MPTPARALAASLAVSAALLAACGDDDGGTNTPNTAPSEVDGGEADAGDGGPPTTEATGGMGGSDGTQGNQVPPGDDTQTTPSSARGADTG